MNKANSISLGCVGLVVLLVLLNLESPSEDGDSVTAASDGGSASSSSSDFMSSTDGSEEGTSRGLTAKTSSTGTALALAGRGSEKQQQIGENRKSLRRFLARDESNLTYEVLADGTELIHMNGTNGHFSAASLGEDGEVVVTCHDSVEGLQSQGQEPVKINSEERTQ